MKKTLTLGLTLVSALALSQPVLADTLAKVKQSGSITMGIRESSYPLSYLDDKQQPIGYHIDICNASSMPSRPSST